MSSSTAALRSRRALTPSVLSTGSETDDANTTTSSQSQQLQSHPLSRQPSHGDVGDPSIAVPTLSQRLRHTSSILAIVISEEHIFAGTQAGEILVYSLTTYEKKAVIEGHRGSVLGLYLSQDQKLLFSSAGDRIVNVWNTKTLKRVCCLYSSFDVGDVFCVAYSASLETAYLGAQNTTIQWCQISQQGTAILPTALRGDDRFFDSRGPGGVQTPRPAGSDYVPRHAKGGDVIEIGKETVRHFAHYGYVYCMLLAREGVPERVGEDTLVTGGGDGVIKLWKLDAKNGGAIEELYSLDDGREEGHAILSIAIDGSFLYSGRSGGEVDVWDLETHQLVRNLKAHRDDVLTICVGGGFLFSAAVTGYIRKYDRQYQLKTRWKAHNGRILSSAFSFNKSRPIYATGSNDNSIAIWDVSDCIRMSVVPSKTSNEQLVESLRRFVSFRTVSSDQRLKADCRRGASYLRSVFKNFGASTEMLPAEDGCNPVILARFRGNPATAGQRKKILFYGHYDVVAANNESGKWLVDPFQMEGIDGYLYGRGTSDNKGPIMAAIFACAELTSEQALGSDIIFLIEGEEECGSRGFERAVKASKDKIGDVDWILLANSYWLDDRIPCLTYGLRGVIHATVQIESSHPDLHSGVDGSAQLDESLKDLVLLLGTLTGKNGEVKIPGFYDPVPELSAEEAELYKDITSALVMRNPDLGDQRALATSLMRRWREASLTIHRFQTSGPDNATIIPRMAKAALSMRLVPNQEATEVSAALVSYLEAEFKKLESNNRLTVTIDHKAEPWLGDLNNDIFKTLEEAIMEAWGPIDQTHHRRKSSGHSLKITVPLQPNGHGRITKPSPTTSKTLANGSLEPLTPLTPMTEVTNKLEEIASPEEERPTQRRKPLYIREGGSIPAIRFLEKEFGAPAAHFPCGQASDSAHLDNERLRLVNLVNSKNIMKKVFRDLPQK
ncbi:Putative peptidase M20, WD40/YVTN repeat-like-containing domain superfamily [Septoria linicola]|uniref:Peptidase M20, WD40/YVTN repeat-like-containing domain superfamily n=1 Tax=Septoria linicola TaxID=215465 RepID=A0A9Q9EGC7_9PEZI|nr:Putative peptidase M20, WD40/YVTN repeat-like-containing domain superfamily [Septoria linicola]